MRTKSEVVERREIDPLDPALLRKLTAQARRDAVANGATPEDGEDALQEVLLRVQRDPRPLESPQLFRTCVIRKIRDIIRPVCRRRTQSFEGLARSGNDGGNLEDRINDELYRRERFVEADAENRLLEAEYVARRNQAAHQAPGIIDARDAKTRDALRALMSGRLDDEEDRGEVSAIIELGSARDTYELAEMLGTTWDSVYYKAYREARKLKAELGI